jgi:hypothetical protein
MALSRDGGKTGGKSRWARDKVQPTNAGRNTNIGGGMSKGSGSKGSLSQLTRKTHKGTGSKGTLRSLLSGTRKSGKSPFPSMARGPLRKP